MEQKLYNAAANLPVTHAQLDVDAVPLKQNNGIRRIVLTFAACAAAICLVMFSALFLAGQVRQYRDAVAYFEQYGLSTEGLTHKEIKDVYLDIITGSFSHPKTAGVLASKNPTEEILYCPAPMTKETYKRLFSTESDDWDPATFWSEDNQEGNVRRYYGTYNGLDVMPQKIPAQTIETYTIAGFDFICNACNIMVKKDGGAGVTLQAAYEKGLLTDKDIEAIYNYHKQTETALYEEFATNYTLPEYIPGSIKLAAKDAYTTWAPKDRQYRMSYYLIMGDFASVVRKSQPDAYNQWKSGINEAIMRGEWNDEMLLVSYIKHFNIPRASMEAALANYIYERTPEQLKMEFYEAPNLDIIYTFDNDIINNYYRYELAPTDSIPQSNLDPVTGLPIGVPEGFVLAPQDAGELAPLNRKYRICYYNAMGAFSSLGSDRPEERDAILQEIWAEVKQGIYRDEMFLVSIIKGLNISREEFDRAYAKSMLQYDPESIMTEYYEIPNGDIIYTFDNEIINAYYRYEEPDWGVVIPKLSENKDHMWFDGQEYHYVDWHIGPDAYIYRDGYYMIWGEFLELANNRPGKSLDEWVKLRIAEADTAQTCNEAALVSFLKYFEIPKEDFETALAKFLSRHTPQELSWDYYWVLADADIIYTFDNEVINAYCRGEGSVVVPEPTDPTDSTDSTVSTEPMSPTDSTDSTVSTDPTKPTSPTDSTDSTVSTEPMSPTDSTDSTVSTEPTNPDNPTQPSDEVVHTHAYKEMTIPPTCTQKGYTFYECSCGHGYTDMEIESLGHNWQEATCNTPKTCTVCGATDGRAKDHVWNAGEVIKEPTETADGKKRLTCTACSAIKIQAIPAKNHVHNYSEIVVTLPTCYQGGYTTHICRCGDSYIDQKTAAVPGHEWADANCMVPMTCIKCGQTEGRVTEHAWAYPEVIKEVTETTDGETRYTCDFCGKTMTEIIPAVGHVHDMKNHVFVKPTCTEVGYMIFTCSCGETYVSGETPASGHSWHAASCTMPKLCGRCGITEGDSLGHTWKNATCIEPKTCTVCSHTNGNPLGHDYKGSVTAPTFDQIGYTTYTCTRCSDSYIHDHTVMEVESVTAPGTLVFRTDGVAYFYGENEEVLYTYTGWDVNKYDTERYSGNHVPWEKQQKNILRVVIEAGVVPSYMDYWFRDCSNLMAVKLPGGITRIDKEMFYGCTNLVSIQIPESVTYIGQQGFAYCSNLDKLKLPAGLTELGVGSFERCTSLKEINIPNGITNIPENAFFMCQSLTDIVIPNSVVDIGRAAFAGCADLISIVIPEGITSIETRIFSGCSSLTNVQLPNGITYIGEYAFNECTSLVSVNIPNTVTHIYESAFEYCESLERIDIPVSVISIGDKAFGACRSLERITYQGTVKQFRELDRGGAIFYGAVDSYVYCIDGKY